MLRSGRCEHLEGFGVMAVGAWPLACYHSGWGCADRKRVQVEKGRKEGVSWVSCAHMEVSSQWGQLIRHDLD
jgi:hypothetical protein